MTLERLNRQVGLRPLSALLPIASVFESLLERLELYLLVHRLAFNDLQRQRVHVLLVEAVVPGCLVATRIQLALPPKRVFELVAFVPVEAFFVVATKLPIETLARRAQLAIRSAVNVASVVARVAALPDRRRLYRNGLLPIDASEMDLSFLRLHLDVDIPGDYHSSEGLDSEDAFEHVCCLLLQLWVVLLLLSGVSRRVPTALHLILRA